MDEVSGLVVGYNQNVLIESKFIQLKNGLWYYHQPLHCSTPVEHIGPNCKVQYSNANDGIMLISYNNFLQYIESVINHTFYC